MRLLLAAFGLIVVTNPTLGCAKDGGECPDIKMHSAQTASNLTPEYLRCEYRVDPLGIDVTNPRLSWIVESARRGQKQTAYHILVASSGENLKAEIGDLWDTGRLDSDQSIHVMYKGKPLTSGMRCCWKVRVWDKNGKTSVWSEPATFEMGLLKPSDWHGRWIGADWHGDWRKGQAPPLPWVRKRFVLDCAPKRARAYVSAMGYYELYINGRKVNDHVLIPAVCDYSKRALYLTHDVTDYLVEGANCIVLWLGRGWYTKNKPGVIHDGPLAKAQVDVTLADGRMVRIGTDTSWRIHPSPITPLGRGLSEQHGGECYDAQKELLGWNTAELDDSNWETAKVFEPPSVVLAAQMVQPNLITETIKPVAVEKLSHGAYMVDMGRNFTGWFELRIRGSTHDSKVKLEYGDKRFKDSRLQTYNQWDEYILSGRPEEVFRCRFNYHGFRWVKITGLHYPPKLDDVRGYLIHTGYEPTSEFECSNDLLNRIYQTVVWTYRCLSLGGYVVDCPHRERLGYGGDGQTSMETALFNFDLGAFFTKWLADWRDTQDPKTGDLPHIAPFACMAGGGPAWSGICVTLSWQFYLQYGDKRILEISYPTIQKWIAFLESKTKDNILEFYVGIGNNGKEWSFLGDWVPPGRGMQPGDRIDDHSTHFFNNCYCLYNVQLAAKIAGVLGKDTDALMYEKKAQTLKRVIHERFFNADKNTYASGEQPYLAFPLLVDVVPEALRGLVMDNLEKAILVKQRGHLNTGMHGTYYMLKLLMQQNRNDLIYEITNKKTYPGWGYMLEQGATTIWEQWDGANSQIHNTLLAIGSWFIQGLGGICIDDSSPGFKHFFIKPAAVGDITFARTKYRSIHGTIISDWRTKKGAFHLDVTVPANTTATVFVPAKTAASVWESRVPAAKAVGVRFLRMDEDKAVFTVDSGQYQFRSKLPR